jgi:hypothetical protein
MRPANRTPAAERQNAERKARDQLLKRARREQECLQWESLPRPASKDRPNPTDEAARIQREEPDKTVVFKLLCGSCPSTKPRPAVGEIFATPYGLLLAAIYDGPSLKGTEASGGLQTFRTGQWLNGPVRPFAARCRRCSHFYVDPTGDIVAKAMDHVRLREKHMVVDQRYRVGTT